MALKEFDEPFPDGEDHAVLVLACKPVTLPDPTAGENGPIAGFVTAREKGSGSKVQFAMIVCDCPAIVVSVNAVRMVRNFFMAVV